MPYGETKVYCDGSHYIAIPPSKRPQKKKKVYEDKELVINERNEIVPEKSEVPTIKLPSGRELVEIEFVNGEIKPVKKKIERKGRRISRKKLFEELYEKHINENRQTRKKLIIQDMRGVFDSLEETELYVTAHMERKQRNVICRRVRLARKIYLHLSEFNYFCTFTYDGKKYNEDEFKKKLKNCLSLFASRKNWQYIGVWERSPEKKRLHFHGIFSIPEGAMPGKIIAVNDYSFKTHKRQITMQNTYFNDRFGRSDFEEIYGQRGIGEAISYLMKYIEKSGERIVYSKGLSQYFISDIMDEDVVCTIGQEDRKLLLFDDFKCFDEGTFIGTVSPETIKEMRKAN